MSIYQPKYLKYIPFTYLNLMVLVQSFQYIIKNGVINILLSTKKKPSLKPTKTSYELFPNAQFHKNRLFVEQ